MQLFGDIDPLKIGLGRLILAEYEKEAFILILSPGSVRKVDFKHGKPFESAFVGSSLGNILTYFNPELNRLVKNINTIFRQSIYIETQISITI